MDGVRSRPCAVLFESGGHGDDGKAGLQGRELTQGFPAVLPVRVHINQQDVNLLFANLGERFLLRRGGNDPIVLIGQGAVERPAHGGVIVHYQDV